MIYGKLIDGQLTVSQDPQPGYKPVRQIEHPENFTDCEGYFVFNWEERGDVIAEVYTYRKYTSDEKAERYPERSEENDRKYFEIYGTFPE